MSTSEHQEPDDEIFEDDDECDLSETSDSEYEHDDHFDEDEDEDDEAASSEAEDVEEFIYEEVGVDSDHRVAQLRKLKHQFGDELSISSHQTLSMDDAGPATIVCPNCNSEEIRGQKFCNNCNVRLPQLPPVEQKYNPGSIDGAARKYYDSIHNFQAGEISLDEFVDFLNTGLEKIRAQAESLAELSADGVIAEWLPDAAALISNATQLWYDSVEGMLLRVDDCQAEHEEEEALLEELDEEELAEREPLAPLDERVRMVDFTHELESIFKANDQMLEYLRIVDTSLKTEATVGGMEF